MVLGAVAEAGGHVYPIGEVGAESPGTSRYPHPDGGWLAVRQCDANGVCGVGLRGAAAGMQDPNGGCPLTVGLLGRCGSTRVGVWGGGVLRLFRSLPCVCHFMGDLAWVAALAAKQRGPGTCVTVQMCTRTCLVISIQM